MVNLEIKAIDVFKNKTSIAHALPVATGKKSPLHNEKKMKRSLIFLIIIFIIIILLVRGSHALFGTAVAAALKIQIAILKAQLAHIKHEVNKLQQDQTKLVYQCMVLLKLNKEHMNRQNKIYSNPVIPIVKPASIDRSNMYMISEMLAEEDLGGANLYSRYKKERYKLFERNKYFAQKSLQSYVKTSLLLDKIMDKSKTGKILENSKLKKVLYAMLLESINKLSKTRYNKIDTKLRIIEDKQIKK